MIIRFADAKDVDQLIQMRWDCIREFGFEESKNISSFSDFEQECYSFFEKAMPSGQWIVWVAEEAGKILSHLYIELIQKVPRPGRPTHPFAYLTRLYTVPEYRNMGIGSKMLNRINEWIKENQYEFVIVWPGGQSYTYTQDKNVHLLETIETLPS